MNLFVFLLMIIASLGVANGFFLSLYLILKKQRIWSDIFFGGLLLALSLRIGKSVYVYFFRDADKLILQIGLSACVFIGPLFYMYMKSLSKAYEKLTRLDFAILILLAISIISIGIIYPYRNAPDIWNAHIIYWIYGIWIIGILFGLYEGRFILKKMFSQEEQLSYKEKSILVIIASVLFITFTFQFALFIKGFTYLWGAIIFTLSFYYLGIRTLFFKEDVVPKSKGLKIPNGDRLLSSLNALMQEEGLFTNPKLKLGDLAVASKMTKHELSKLLNEEYKFGFNAYINSFRVQKAKELIQTREDLSLEGIGYESGFNSKSSFYATFKKIANCTPAEFKKRG